MAFDGANVWVAGSGVIYKLRASDGVILGSFPGETSGMSFDGSNVWLTDQPHNSVIKLRASDGARLGVFPAGNSPADVAFDGTNIWVTNASDSASVTKLRASDGQKLATYFAGDGACGIAFDGANMWVANAYSNSATKLRVSDGAVLGAFPVGREPCGIAFDGANIWTADFQGNTVTKLRAGDGTSLGTFPVGSNPHNITFDGANVWVTNRGSNTVSRIATASPPSGATVTINYVVPGTSMPWRYSVVARGLNYGYQYGLNDGTSPVVVSSKAGFNFTPGNSIVVKYLSGTASIGPAGYPYTDANGLLFAPVNDKVGSTGKVAPSHYINPSTFPIYTGELVGAFTDASGAIAGVPFAVGNGPATLTIPSGATQLQFGVNDDSFIDNAGAWTVQVVGSAISATAWATPSTLTFTYRVGDSNPAAQNVVVSSSEGGLSFSAQVLGAGWLSVSPTSGITPASVTASVKPANLSPGTYDDTIRLAIPNAVNATLEVPVRLVIGPPQFNVTPTSLTFTAPNSDSGRLVQTLSTTSSASLSVTVEKQTTANWLTISPNSSQRTPATFSITASAYGLAAGLYLSSLRVSAGTNVTPVIVPVQLAACSINLTPDPVSVPSQGGGVELFIDTTSGCPWALSADSWIILPSSRTGTGPARVQLQMAANPRAAARSGKVFVSGVTATVNQSGSPCSLSMTASPTKVGAAGGTVNLTLVVSPSDCEWSLSVKEIWAVPDRLSGTGNATVRLTVAPNMTDASRDSTVKYASQSLVIRQSGPPIIVTSGIVNAASFRPGDLSPGGLVSIFGVGIGPDSLVSMVLDKTGLVSSTLSSTRVLFDDTPAPLLYVSGSQIGTVAPYSLDGRSFTQVVVEYAGVKSPPVGLHVTDATPAIFTADSSGDGQIAALNEDGSYNSERNPVRRGSFIVLFATGAGQTEPAGVDGRIAQSVLPKPHLPVRVFIGNGEADIYYAGAAPELIAGVLQVNVHVPTNAPVGSSVPIRFVVGSAQSQQNTTVAIQ